MAIEKQLLGRIIHKHDIEENWDKATGFIPKQGEIIVYDIDENYNYERFKIGDGNTSIINLPFQKTNINDLKAVSYDIAQKLTDDQKAQARTNIGAVSIDDIPTPDVQPNAIIDGTELPTEDINKNSWYRLLTGKFVYNQEEQSSFTARCVNELPEVGDPVTTGVSDVLAYYSISDNDVYGYINDTLAASAGVPAGWYTLAMLAPVFDVSWSGIITDIDDDPCDDSFRLLLRYDFYMFQDGWCKVPFAYEKAPEFDIQWDGVIGDRFALDVSSLGFDNTYFIKVSDEVFTVEQLIGARYTHSDGTEGVLDSSYIYEDFAGALNTSSIVIVYNSNDLNAALGLPEGYVTNGTYFVYIIDSFYHNRLVAPPKITKIDSKYFDVEVDAYNIDGLAVVATSGNYNDLYNRPMALCYDARYSIGSQYQQNVRSTIEVYSRREVDTRINDNINTVYNDCVSISGDTMTGSLVLSADPVGDMEAATKKYVDDGLRTYFSNFYIPESIGDYNVKIVYGDGKFVAINTNYAGDLVIAYSEDGVNWSEITLSYKGCYGSLIYADGKFVAVNSDYRYHDAIYSIDGINWYQTNMPIMTRWNNRIDYANGTFVTFTMYNSNMAAYSTDGITWNQTTLPVTGRFSHVTNGNGIFVAVDSGDASKSIYSNIAIYSTDGITWNQTTLPETTCWSSITYGNGIFLATSGSSTPSDSNDHHHQNSKIAAYSIDGINWHQTILPEVSGTTGFWSNVVYGDDKFIAVYDNSLINGSRIIAYSTDCVDWTQVALPITINEYIVYGRDKFVAFSYEFDSNIAIYSTDGIAWNKTILPFKLKYGNSYYCNDRFISINKGKLAYSVDGINWTDKSDKISSLTQSNTDVTEQVAQVIQPYLTLTASNIGALPADTVIPSIEGLATESYVNIRVPAWTEADEGKILRIVNGTPTWTTIPAAEEVGF